MRLLIVIGMVLTGCASASKTYTSEGKEGFSLNCSGTARNWGMCYEKAGELCGARGYDVLEKSGEQGFVAGGGSGGFGAGSTFNRSMIVRCK